MLFKTYAANFTAISCVGETRKVVRVLSFDHLRFRIKIVYKNSYVRWIFPQFLDKIKQLNVSEISIDPLSELIVLVPNTDK